MIDIRALSYYVRDNLHTRLSCIVYMLLVFVQVINIVFDLVQHVFDDFLMIIM